MRYALIVLTMALAGCGTVTPQDMFEAVKIRDGQCGTASIIGNMDIGGTMGFFGTTVVVNIEKEQKTYKDSSDTLQDCP